MFRSGPVSPGAQDFDPEQQIELARSLAAEFHSGQLYDQECGITYFDGHLSRAVAMGEMICRVTGRDRYPTIPTLWLHDSIEDVRRVNRRLLVARGISPLVAGHVGHMTHDSSVSEYHQYTVDITRVEDDTPSCGKLGDNIGNFETNMAFHWHEDELQTLRRLLRYSKSISELSARVLNDIIRVDDEQLRELARDSPAKAFKLLTETMVATKGMLNNINEEGIWRGDTHTHEAQDAAFRDMLLTKPRTIRVLLSGLCVVDDSMPRDQQELRRRTFVHDLADAVAA